MSCECTDVGKYGAAEYSLKKEFQSRISDYRDNKNYFARPFSVSVEEMPENFRSVIQNCKTSSTQFPEIQKYAQKMMSMFGST